VFIYSCDIYLIHAQSYTRVGRRAQGAQVVRRKGMQDAFRVRRRAFEACARRQGGGEVKTFSDALKEGSVKLRDYVERAAQNGELDDRLFAVDLSKADAIDAAEFFDRTELVENLENLVRQVLRPALLRNLSSRRGIMYISNLMSHLGRLMI